MNREDVKKTAAAVLAMHDALPEPVLTLVLKKYGITWPPPARVDNRFCHVCGLRYPGHAARWADDHDFEVVHR